MSDTTTITPPSPPGTFLPRRPDYNDVDCAGCPERRRGYLTWTHEPPKVAGWYWFSIGKGHAVCLLVCADGKAKLAKDHFTDADMLGGEWAGPIAPPVEG